MNPSHPAPQLPPGWIALWDEGSQRYYYLEQATGRTQWELPTQPSSSFNPVNSGEANSYHSNFLGDNSPATSSYPPQQQNYPPQFPSANSPQVATSYPGQQQQAYPYPGSSNPQSPYPPTGMEGEQQDRGLGKMLKGPGGAIAAGLIGFAAGKLMNNHHGGHHNQQQPYYPPPPPGYGGYPQGYGGHHGNHHKPHFF
ncbi:hypothetical protein CU097_005574 [Rhizopus azygosporus]|uniref:WW domain-containing protein n=1 Tax=Rhizopus azygosporus TaxID=86630 RepID=A0A367JS71_RHIAZ|nr:hypothetical protein CU097_005574 [Rhizopus azygosporus]CEG68007.1 Putative CPII coat sec24 protein [Rhizopus microsporus]